MMRDGHYMHGATYFAINQVERKPAQHYSTRSGMVRATVTREGGDSFESTFNFFYEILGQVDGRTGVELDRRQILGTRRRKERDSLHCLRRN